MRDTCINVLNFASPKKRIAFQYEKILVFLLALPFFCPSYFLSVNEDLKLFIYILRIVSFFVITTRLLVSGLRVNVPCLLVVFMQIWITFVTFVNNRIEFNSSLIQSLSGISVFLLIVSYKKKSSSLIDGLLLLFEINIYLNLLFIFADVLPHYTGYQYYLGNENSLALFFLPGLLLSLLHFHRTHNFVRFLMFFAALITSVIIIWSATTTVAIFGCILVLILFYFRRKPIRAITLWIATILISVILVFFSSSIIDIPVFKWFITEVLGKDITLSDRFAVWGYAISMIRESPLFGYGYNTIIYGMSGFASHAHNFYLELFIVGGAVYFVAFVALIVLTIKRVDGCKNRKLALICSSALFSMFITFITEAYSEIWKFYLIFAICLIVDELDTKKIYRQYFIGD